MNQIYDMVIVGGGPGGYTAALYATRAGMKTLILEKLSAGGQMALTHQIDNYPGFEEGIDGFTLATQMQNQAKRFGAETKITEVTKVDWRANPKAVHTAGGVVYGKTVVLATGANPRKLGLDGEDVFAGKGIHYCAACDGMFYRGKTVAVVGGGDTAAVDALLLSRVAKKVYLIHRRDSLRATKVYHESLEKAENVEFVWSHTVKSLLHGDKFSGLQVENVRNGEISSIVCDGVFVSVGRIPASELGAGELVTDEHGYVLADESTQTSVPGVYAVGDVRTKALRQVVTAVADGAVAVHYAQEFLAKQ